MVQDLDQGGRQQQTKLIYLGPTKGWINVDEPGSIEFVIESSTAPILAGYKGVLLIPWYGIITSWVLLAEAVGSAVVDVYKIPLTTYLAGTLPTVANSITGTELPTITAGIAASSSLLPDWITEIKQNDVLAFNVNSCTDISKLTIIVYCTKSIGQISGVGVA